MKTFKDCFTFKIVVILLSTISLISSDVLAKGSVGSGSRGGSRSAPRSPPRSAPKSAPAPTQPQQQQTQKQQQQSSAPASVAPAVPAKTETSKSSFLLPIVFPYWLFGSSGGSQASKEEKEKK